MRRWKALLRISAVLFILLGPILFFYILKGAKHHFKTLPVLFILDNFYNYDCKPLQRLKLPALIFTAHNEKELQKAQTLQKWLYEQLKLKNHVYPFFIVSDSSLLKPPFIFLSKEKIMLCLQLQQPSKGFVMLVDKQLQVRLYYHLNNRRLFKETKDALTLFLYHLLQKQHQVSNK